LTLSLIRPLELDDLPAVEGLLDAHLVIGRHGARHTAATFARETLLASPWADSELPSLVATEGGAVIGFFALHARRVRFDDRTLRAACCSHLVVDPRHRAGAAGALLIGRCLQGPQDLTISDTANDVVARVWSTFGGRADAARSCEWMHVLRPGRLATRLARQWASGTRPNRGDLPVPGLPLHIAARFVPRLRVPQEPNVHSEPLTVAQAVDELPAAARGLRLRADYDEAYLRWLFGRLETMPGEVVLRMVRRASRAVGWYVYVLGPTGRGRVLQVFTGLRHADVVVGDLLADGRARGATLMTGRLEPHLFEPLRRRLTSVGFGARHVVHSRHADVLAAHASPAAVVSRLDGEWW